MFVKTVFLFNQPKVRLVHNQKGNLSPRSYSIEFVRDIYFCALGMHLSGRKSLHGQIAGISFVHSRAADQRTRSTPVCPIRAAAFNGQSNRTEADFTEADFFLCLYAAFLCMF